MALRRIRDIAAPDAQGAVAAKILGVAAILGPTPARVKEWAYAGFAITLVSAIVAHSSTDGIATAALPMFAAVLLVASYLLKLNREAAPSAESRAPIFV